MGVSRSNIFEMVCVSVEESNRAIVDIDTDIHRIEVTEHITRTMNSGYNRTYILCNDELMGQSDAGKFVRRIFVYLPKLVCCIEFVHKKPTKLSPGIIQNINRPSNLSENFLCWWVSVHGAKFGFKL